MRLIYSLCCTKLLALVCATSFLGCLVVGASDELLLRDDELDSLLSSNGSSNTPSTWDTLSCKAFKTMLPPDNQTSLSDYHCALIHNITSCAESGGFIPYLSLIYCSLPVAKPVAYVILFIWLLFLFISLGTTAEDFFCPALTTISQTMGLSQNIAGVTFLAFGNGAPDIFSAFAAIQQAKNGDAGLAIGALFGAGVFVTTTVVGAICITKSFALTQRPFLRDVIFYLAAVFWTFYVLWNHKMTTWQAAGFIAVYVFYVLVVGVGRYVYQKSKKRRRGHGDIPSPPTREPGKELGGSITIGNSVNAGSPLSLNDDADDEDDDDQDDETFERRPLLHGTSSNGGRSLHAPATQYGSAGTSSPSANGMLVSPPACRGSGDLSPSSPSAQSTNSSSDPLTKSGPQEPGAWVRRSLSRQSSRQRSDSYHGVTSHNRQMTDIEEAISATRPAGTTNGGNGVTRTGDEEGETTSRAVQHYLDLEHSHSRSHMRRSTMLVAGALAGLVSTSAAAVPIRRMPRLVRRSSSLSDLDTQPLIPSTSTTSSDPPSALAALARRRQEDASPSSGRFLALRALVQALNPVDSETFATQSLIWKLYDIFKAPIQFLLLITTPVVMLDQEDQNWNHALNSLQCLTGPVVITLLISGISSYIADTVPTVAVVAAGGSLLAIVIYCTSRNDKPPAYHRVFAFAGFLVAVVWIYAIANEIVSLLTTFGVVFGISDAILGLTLLAWGNSIGDFVSNVTMAKQGFPRMAIAACFGGPLLNVLLGIGIASLMKSVKNGGSFCLHFRPLQILCAAFLMASLCLSLVAMLLLKFNTSKKYGILLVCFYVVFLSIAIVEEVGLLPWKTTYVCPDD